MKCFIFAVFLLCIFLPSAYSRHVQFYRKDYTYIQEFDAFYKVHWDVSVTAWSTAFLTCDDEGATLFYPEVQGEWTLVKNLTDQMTKVPNLTEIFVGLHDEFKLGQFITVDGHTTPYPLPADRILLPHLDHCIAMNIDTGKFIVKSCLAASNTPLPFVCKKVDEDDESCPTIDHGYKYLKTSKKCYKINEKQLNWQEAMKTCFMEGGILAVIENSAQAQEISDILKQRESYFVGVKKVFTGADYYTVKGKKISDIYMYYDGPNPYKNDGNSPYDNVPNEGCNYPDENGELPDENGLYPDGRYCQFNIRVKPSTDCGTVRKRDNNYLYTETQNCDEHLPFICEMEVGV